MSFTDGSNYFRITLSSSYRISLLMIDKMVTRNCRRRQTNLNMAWTVVV